MNHRGPFDIVFCRNVLIYFDTDTKKQILANIRSAMQRGGYVLLGAAETVLSLDDNFKRTELGKAILYQAP
jgi:chemotaxis protein methyltransferase CheR